jgi:hypothetical protein
MAKSKHIILEQIIDLQVPDTEKAYRIQEQASHLFLQRILPIIDRHCSELCDPDTFTSIESLKIDLGELSLNRFKLDFEEQFRRQFSNQLSAAIQAEGLVTQQQKEEAKTKTQGELFDFFIRFGGLPWWADSNDKTIIQRSFHHLVKHDANELKRKLLQYLQKEVHLKRLILHLGDPDLKEAIITFNKSLQSHIESIFSDFEMILQQLARKKKLAPSQVRIVLWKGILSSTFKEISDKELIRRLMIHLSQSLSISFEVLNEIILALDKGRYKFKSPLKEVFKKVKSQSPFSFNLKNIRDDEREENSSSPTLLGQDLQGQIDQPQQFEQETDFSVAEDNDQTQELFINNAGLVILWPFLSRFFENLGLVHEKTFVDEWAPQKAMALLQYIVDAAIQVPEYLVPLNKILCGMPLEALYEQETIELEENWLEQSTLFLETILEHAEPAIGKISVEGFQNTFLKRSGILSFEDGHWLLRVERETFDLVLDRLPWSFRIVKLPWMEYGLYVDW